MTSDNSTGEHIAEDVVEAVEYLIRVVVRDETSDEALYLSELKAARQQLLSTQ